MLEVGAAIGAVLIAFEVCWWVAVVVVVRGYWSFVKEMQQIPIEYL